jgi:eukaryotic-like serine/threonine-protein kinase
MSHSRWQTVSQIFEAALDLPSHERDRFIREACGGNPELEREVIRLLTADEKAGSFLEGPALGTLPAQSHLAASPLLADGLVIAGRFEIVRFIGEGGMGQVYEALDLELKSRIALKAIRPEIATDPRMLSRFRREVQLTRMITHPNVCRTFDIERHTSSGAPASGYSGNLTFLTMELLEGETLSARLRRAGRLTPAEALPLVLQMIDALASAHAVGVIHRDFKPSNVLLVPTGAGKASSSSSAASASDPSSSKPAEGSGRALRAVVTDFGLARAVAVDLQNSGPVASASMATSLTGDQALMGTLIYMAPEQFERGETSVASDIYSLGLVMFEMITGQRPFADDIPFAEAAKRLKQPAPSVTTIVPDIAPVWDRTISRCLALNPQDRFENVQQITQALTDLSQVVSPRLIDATRDDHAPRLIRRSKLLVAVTIFALVVSLSPMAFRHYLRRQIPIQFSERDWILVTDFTNKTGEKLFDRVVRDLAVQSLSQSSYLNIVPRFSALEAAKRIGLKEVNSIDEKLGRELCFRENYRVLLTGNIFKNGSRYTIAIRIEVPGKDSASISDAETIQSPDGLFPGVDRLAARIRRKLGESSSTIERSKPLAQVTTLSLEALQRYSTALDLYDAREFQRCINLANDAVEQDPAFAMAHLLLAQAYEQMANEAQSRKEFDQARAHLDRASERERHLILAAAYASNLQNDKAAQEYQHLLDLYPDDVEALRNFAIATYYAGHPERGIAAQRKALALNPDDPGSYDYLMELLVRTNQFSDALAIYQQAQTRNLKTTGFRFLAALAAWGNGDLPKAQELLAVPASEGNDYTDIVSKLYSGKLLAFQGRFREAEDAFRAGLGLSHRLVSEDWARVFQYQLASTKQASGNVNLSKPEIHKYVALVKTATNAGTLERAGNLSLSVGDLNAAEIFLRLCDTQAKVHDDSFSEMELHTLAGEIALAQGHRILALKEERTALDFQESYEPLLALGVACEQNRNWNCAIDAYSRYLGMKGAVLRYDVASDWVVAHFSLAKVYVASGKPDRGVEYYRKFLDFFVTADPDLPIVLEAKQELKLLEATSKMK